MRFVGIDWGTEAHVFSVVDEGGVELGSRLVEQKPASLSEALDWVEQLAPGTDGRVFGVEAGAFVLVDFLLSREETLYVVPPKWIDRCRDRHNSSQAKDDGLDAFVTADFLRTDRHRLRVFTPDSDVTAELKLRTRARDRLVQKRASICSELKAVLRQFFPGAADLTDSRHTNWLLEFLKAYPDAAVLESAKRTNLDRFLKERRVRKWDGKALKEHVRQAQVPIRESALRALRAEAQDLVAEILLLNEQVRVQEGEIRALLKQHPDRDLILSLPGFQETLAARVLAELGDDRARFDRFDRLQAYVGTAPVTSQTGRKQKKGRKGEEGRKLVKKRHAFNTQLHQALFLQSNASIRTCDWAKAFYCHRRRSGDYHATAVRALANKWAKILWAILKSRNPYDEERHLRALSQQPPIWWQNVA